MCLKRTSNGVLALLALLTAPAPALAFDYQLQVQPAAAHTWVVEGTREEFAATNGGDIANAAFIATGHGVILIDSGATLAYGNALRQVIAGVVDEPVRWLINTHHHPDHTFGNQAFPEAEILALPGTIDALRRDAAAFRDNLYQRLGDAVRGTEPVMPGVAVSPGRRLFAGYPLKLLAFRGHSGADLVVLDPATGVLFTGDLVFNQRAPTTPHSPGLKIWRHELAQIKKLAFKKVVPGHGPVADSAAPIEQTRAYLGWLASTFAAGARQGATRNEVIETPIPEAFQDMALVRFELTRSVSHLYGRYEDAVFAGE